MPALRRSHNLFAGIDRDTRAQMHLFVYGTLKRGLCRSAALDGQTFLGDATTRAAYRMFDVGTYPGLVIAEDGISIHGELYAIDDDCRARLDVIEDVAANQYRLLRVELLPPHEEIEAFAYIYQCDVTGLRDCGSEW